MKNSAESENRENVAGLSEEKATTSQIEETPESVVVQEENIKTEPNEASALEEIRNAKEIPEPRLENINTVADFIKKLEECLEKTEDEEERIEISYHIARIKGALAMADTQPEKLRIGAVKDGRLSMYDRNQQKIRIDEDLLEDIPKYGKLLGLAVKEAEAEKAGFADIGFQQLAIQKSGISTGEYHKQEKGVVARIFGRWGRDNVLERCNIQAPEKLADYFLEKEIETRFKAGKKIKPEELAPYLAVQFKKGAPVLYKKLKQNGYGFRTRAREIILKFENSK